MKKNIQENLKTHLGLFVVSLIFGTNYVFTKIIMLDVSPTLWTFYRALIATVTLLPFLIGSPVLKELKNPRIWIAGLLGIVLNQLFFTEGLKRTTPSHSSLINACIPAATLAISILAKTEKWSLKKAVGVMCAVGGVSILIFARTAHSTSPATQALGDALTVANVLSFSIFLVISLPLAKQYSALSITGFYFLEGTLLLIPYLGVHYYFAPSISNESQWHHDLLAWYNAPIKTHLMMLFVATFASSVTYALNNWALRRAEPSMVATYVTVQPIIAAWMSMWLYNEKLSSSFYPAFILVALGVWLSSRKSTPQTK